MNDIPENTGPIRNEKGQFIEGVSGNPLGKPKGAISVVSKIKEELLKIAPTKDGKGTKTYLELLVARYLKQAIQDGDTRLIMDIIDRIDGKALQKIEADVKNQLPDIIEDLNNNVNLAKRIRNYVNGQGMEDDSPVQDQEQTGGDNNIPAEPDTA